MSECAYPCGMEKQNPYARAKQRIELTDYCQEFCEKNDEMSRALLKEMFTGVSEEQLQTTIQTIIQIEDNLKEIRNYEQRYYSISI